MMSCPPTSTVTAPSIGSELRMTSQIEMNRNDLPDVNINKMPYPNSLGLTMALKDSANATHSFSLK